MQPDPGAYIKRFLALICFMQPDAGAYIKRFLTPIYVLCNQMLVLILRGS